MSLSNYQTKLLVIFLMARTMVCQRRRTSSFKSSRRDHSRNVEWLRERANNTSRVHRTSRGIKFQQYSRNPSREPIAVLHSSGATSSSVSYGTFSLMSREITSQDYELLSELDKGVKSTNTLTDSQLSRLSCFRYKRSSKNSDIIDLTQNGNENESSKFPGNIICIDCDDEKNDDVSLASSSTPQLKNRENDKIECSICMDAFQDGQMISALPCHHIFHYDCILPKLSQQNSCPIDKFKVF